MKPLNVAVLAVSIILFISYFALPWVTLGQAITGWFLSYKPGSSMSVTGMLLWFIPVAVGLNILFAFARTTLLQIAIVITVVGALFGMGDYFRTVNGVSIVTITLDIGYWISGAALFVLLGVQVYEIMKASGLISVEAEPT